MNEWTKPEDDFLRLLWGKDIPCGEIAKRLGTRSRNAVIGRAHRLGLSKRADPIPRKPKPQPLINGCKYIAGEPVVDPDYCGAESLPHQDWCADHRAIVYHKEDNRT